MAFQIDIPERVERLSQLDPVAERVSTALGKVVPSQGPTKDFLSGVMLGHPLHPLLTDVVLGCFFSAFFLDAVGGKQSRPAAQRLIGIGLLAAVPTAAAGVADWIDTIEPKRRRVGLVHAGANLSGLLFFGMSWRARKKGRHMRGRFWSLLGGGLSSFAGLLGGHLVYRTGLGVNETAFEKPRNRWSVAVDESELPEEKLTFTTVDGVEVLLYRRGGTVHALHDRCSHRGCPLHRGEVSGGSVTCPCHGSTFSLEDGSIVRGPATAPQPAYEARIQEGKVEVRPRG
jgi:nitrite reductase/ring-hydroxylating ferredoxin subunit/uncharacterized membrane protein